MVGEEESGEKAGCGVLSWRITDSEHFGAVSGARQNSVSVGSRERRPLPVYGPITERADMCGRADIYGVACVSMPESPGYKS